MRGLKSEPALLSETLVLVSLTRSMGVLIAVVLQKLSIEFLHPMSFSRARTTVALNEMAVSSHSLFPCRPLAHFSLPWFCHFPFFLFFSPSLSHPSLLHLWGHVMNGFPALIGWCTMLLGGMKAYKTQRIWNGERGEKKKKKKLLEQRYWNVLTSSSERERVGGVLQMHACNNGSRSHLHWCFNPGTLPSGNSPTDLVPASSCHSLDSLC